MAKHRTKCWKGQQGASGSRSVAIELPSALLSRLVETRASVMELCIQTGLEVVKTMMEEDRTALCGPARKHDRERRAHRGGTVASEITVGGRRVAMRRPRVRSMEREELALPSFAWASARDPLDEATWEAIASGVATRRYERVLPGLPEGLEGRASSRSCVSRRFVALSQRKLAECLARPLGDLDLWVVLLDGIVFAERTVLAALGIASDGRKHVLGLWEGTTENATVGRALLRDLVARGLATDRPLLFVIDGAAALRKALRETFGDLAVVQRCQVHKIRNVLGHLPERMRPRIHKALAEAYALPSAKLAKRRLEQLARALENEHPSAARSLREGLDETLTLQRLGIQGALRDTLRSTNPIENLNSAIAKFTRNVKRWSGGAMILRWVGSAVLEAEQRFRRVKGYRQMPQLIHALMRGRSSAAMVKQTQAA